MRSRPSTIILNKGKRSVITMLFFSFVIAMIVFIVIAIKNEIDQKQKRNQKTYRSPSRTYVDTPSQTYFDLVSKLTDEEKAVLKKIQDFVRKERFTEEDFKRYMAYSIDQDFQAMEGWRIWDKSIQEEPGQYERLKRAIEQHLQTICYDGTYKIGIVNGSSGNRYLVNYCQCSCPDYRKRRLPCKHMYALATFLDGDVDSDRGCGPYTRLDGLTIALAGKFHHGKDDPAGVRKKINRRGAVWSTTIDFDTSAVVLGENPGPGKLDFAKQYDMVLLQEQDIEDIFTGTSTRIAVE